MNVLDSVLTKPGIILVGGSIGEGKTSLTFRFAEKIHEIDDKRIPYVFSLNKNRNDELLSLLPDYFRVTNSLDLRKLPYGAVLIGDEGTVWANSKNFKTGVFAEKLGGDLATIRQRNQIFFVIIQNFALLELDYFRMGVTFALKWISPLSLEFDRSNMRDILQEIMNYFKSVNINRKELFYLLSGDDGGFYSNILPSFWSERLSCFWGG
jgi:hypothetical protein